ncbi:hypothetical protein DPEC_G00295960 [Dallia pectoralis]|uniref:Uncharacterized protein n=1 Tax=Dallia pectoralis TaxID=75939 RepID=A0ACC2FIY5_DALPE|nr:hypothetical protein DPEC_G00295960 [Dallia pectoralis]
MRKRIAEEQWQEARHFHLECMVTSKNVLKKICKICQQEEALVRCRDCLPLEWFCAKCDQNEHSKWPLHNREVIIEDFYKPVAPSTYLVKREDGHYNTCEQVCPPSPCSCEFQSISVSAGRAMILIGMNGRYDLCLPVWTCNGCLEQWAPGVKELIHSGEIRSVVKSTPGRGTCGASQWSAARETAKRANKLDEEGVEVAVCRHGYILKGLNMFRGEIFAYPMFLQKALQAPAKFFATYVACKYWPYLEKVAGHLTTLQELLSMKPFLSVMHARAHATKCEIKWSGRNQEGAGTTCGEEVEQVNSYLSRCGLNTKKMTKSARVDMLTVHAIGWNSRKSQHLQLALSKRYVKTCQNAFEEATKLEELKQEVGCSDDMVKQWILDVQQWAVDENEAGTSMDSVHLKMHQSIEGHFVNIHQMKHSLYRQNDGNKVRNKLRQKIAVEKKLLIEDIRSYNLLVPKDLAVDEEVVGEKLAGPGSGSEAQIWPWEIHSRGSSVTMLTKKKVHDQYMLSMRLLEEKIHLVREMTQHCSFLNSFASVLRAQILSSGMLNSY